VAVEGCRVDYTLSTVGDLEETNDSVERYDDSLGFGCIHRDASGYLEPPR
jgi:hypothetical protein